MADGGANSPAPPSENGGEFLLSLLHRRPYQQEPSQAPQIHHHHHHQSYATLDPAIAAVGPTVNAYPPSNWQSNGRERVVGTNTPPPPPWSLAFSPPNLNSPNLLGFSQFPINPFPTNRFDGNQRVSPEDAYRLGFTGGATGNLPIQPPLENRKLVFGSFSGDPTQSLVNGNSNSNTDPNRNHEQRGGFSGRGNWGPIGNNNGRGLKSNPPPPPGFSSNQQRGWDIPKGENSNIWDKSVDLSAEEDRLRRLAIQSEGRFNLGQQIDHPGPPKGASLHSVSAADAEDSFSMLNKEVRGGGRYKEELGKFSKGKREGDGEFGPGDDEIRDFGEDIVESLLLDDETDNKDAKDDKKNSRASREKVNLAQSTVLIYY